MEFKRHDIIISDLNLGQKIQKDGSMGFDDEQVITLTQEGRFVRRCEHAFSPDKFLRFRDINFDDIVYLDINPEPYLMGISQIVLNKIINNSKNFLTIHHYTTNKDSILSKNLYERTNGRFIDYINSIKKINKKIYLEYIVMKDEPEVLKTFKLIRKEVFEMIEIHMVNEIQTSHYKKIFINAFPYV